MQTCVHGQRKLVHGTSAKGPWHGWMCPTPKGAADKCDPIWADENGNPKAASPAKAAAQQASSEQLAILREMNNTLLMMFAWMKLRFPSDHGPNAMKAVPMPAQPEPTFTPKTANAGEEDIDVSDIPF